MMQCFPKLSDLKQWKWWKKKLLKHFLPLGFIVALILGLSWPWLGDTISSWKLEGYRIVPTIHLLTIFIISGLTLKTQDAIDALKAPKGLLYGLVSILGITPILGFAVLQLPFDNESFSTGLAIFCTVPTTLSSGIALVQAAYGNAALALLLCTGSNIIGIATVPFFLKAMLSSSSSLSLDAVDLLLNLVISILVPLTIGKLLLNLKFFQQLTKNHKTVLKLLNNGSLVSIVWQSISRAQDDITSTPAGQIFLLILAGVAIHMIYLSVNGFAATLLQLSQPDFKAVLLMASQKTLPISIAVISFLPEEDFGRQGLLTIPCIIGHLSQLFIDAFIASRMASAEEARREAAEEEEGKEESEAVDSSGEQPSHEMRLNGSAHPQNSAGSYTNEQE